MKRKPITKQRSPWDVYEPIPATESMHGNPIARFGRNVHDGVLFAMVDEYPPCPEGGGWHLSISHQKRVKGGHLEPGRYPTWDEIADARDELLPSELGFVMHLPGDGDYVALHPTTFHLHEYPPRVSP